MKLIKNKIWFNFWYKYNYSEGFDVRTHGNYVFRTERLLYVLIILIFLLKIILSNILNFVSILFFTTFFVD
jgi:hypothetical protein